MPVVGVGRDKLFELLGGEYAKFSMSLFCYVLHESLLHHEYWKLYKFCCSIIDCSINCAF
jgi:hypothetical protein